MGVLDMTAFDAMWKEIYPAGVPEEVAFRRCPLYNDLKKQDDFEGDAYVVPIITSGPAGGRSADLAKAITGQSASVSKKFVIPDPAEDFISWGINARALYASRSKRGAFVEARKSEGDLALKQLGSSMCHALYGDGSGALAIVGGVPVGDVITLATPRDARFFEPGMVLIADNTATGLSPRSGTMIVESRDEDAGTVTVDTLVSGTTTGDYLFVDGDASAKLHGLESWIPLTTPTSTLFFGVNRALDPTRLAGSRINNADAGIRENVSQLLELLHERGGDPNRVYISPPNFNALARDTESTVERDQDGDIAKFGFKRFAFQYSGGVAMVTADPFCPSNRAWALQTDTWWIPHLEGLPHIVRDDGKDSVRGSTTNTIQMRARYWAELVCKAPAWNGVCAL